MTRPEAVPCLDDSLEFRRRAPEDGYGGELLISGCASPIGVYLLAELLRDTAVTVHAPVAAGDFAAGYDQIRRRLADCGQWDPVYARRIQPVPADLGRQWFGLPPAIFVDLATRLDAIYHCAADNHLMKSYEELAPVNVQGTHELLRLAAYGRGVRFHHVSIITVAPVDPAANRCAEAWPDESRAVCGAHDIYSAAGFIRTRWAAEHLVADAARRGLDASIYRTRTLAGDSFGRYPDRDVLSEYIRGTVRAGVYPPDRVGHWTPVDYAAKAIVLLATHRPGVYHIPGYPVPLRWAWEHAQKWSYPLREGTDDEWRAAVMAARTPLAYLIDNGADPSAPGLEPDCSQALGLVGSTLGPPVITADMVGRYLDQMRAAGSL